MVVFFAINIWRFPQLCFTALRLAVESWHDFWISLPLPFSVAEVRRGCFFIVMFLIMS